MAETGPFELARDTLVVRGPDRKTWLNGLLTSEVTRVEPGRAGYGLLLTKQGKIVSDVFLVDAGDTLFLGVGPGLGEPVRESLDRYLVMEDAELEAASQPLRWVLGAAPASVAGSTASGELTLGGFVAQVGIAGASAAPALPAAGPWLAEQGLGTFGVDFDTNDNPHEASLDRLAVSWTKGCYLGQEVVCMQDMRGKVKRRLVAVDGRPELALAASQGRLPADVLGGDGTVVGQLTSVHEAEGIAHGMARISAAVLEAGGELSALGESLRVAARSTAKLG